MDNPELVERRYTAETVLKALGGTTIKLTPRKLKGMQRRNAINKPPYSLRQLSIAFMLEMDDLRELLKTATVADLEGLDIEALDMKLLHEVERYEAGRWQSYDAASAAGQLLVKARRELAHGEFVAFAERAGLTARTAQRWMQLARAGFDADRIAAFGGIRMALDSLAKPKSDTVSLLTGDTADDVRRQELEFENVELKRQLGDKLATATPEQLEQLEQYAILLRTQDVIAEARNRMYELITENESLKQERTALKQERESLRASIATEGA